MGLAPWRISHKAGSGRSKLLLSVFLCLLLLSGSVTGLNRSPKFPKTLKAKGLRSVQSKEETPSLRDLGSKEETPSLRDLGSKEETPSLKDVASTEEADSKTNISKTATLSDNTSSSDGKAAEKEVEGSDSDAKAKSTEVEDETEDIVKEILSHPNLNLTLLSQATAKDRELELKSKEEEESVGLNSTIVIKARLKPDDVLGKGGKKKDPHAKLLKGNKHTSKDGAQQRVKRSGGLDVVLAHHDIDRTEQMVDYWLAFLQMEKVQALKPYVFIYCQNEKYDLSEEDFKPILQLGGEIVHLPNIGRESHAYLEHITKRYNDLANHTLFAQDASYEGLPERFEKLFEFRTGFLPLSLVGHVDCEDPWLPKGVIPQIYAMFANELCPPVGYTSSFEGQFVVSKKRILRNGWWTYQRLLDLLAADENHWIHAKHDHVHFKDKSNPLFGHVLERTWSVAFECFESWREGNCWQCIVPQGMQGCGEGDCQCFDKS